MFIFQPFTDELHSCSYARQSTVIGLGNAVLYSFIRKSATVRFFEYAAKSAGGERLCRGGAKPRACGPKPITLFY